MCVCVVQCNPLCSLPAYASTTCSLWHHTLVMLDGVSIPQAISMERHAHAGMRMLEGGGRDDGEEERAKSGYDRGGNSSDYEEASSRYEGGGDSSRDEEGGVSMPRVDHARQRAAARVREGEEGRRQSTGQFRHTLFPSSSLFGIKNTTNNKAHH